MPIGYFKGQPTDFIVRYTGGRQVSSGMGLAFFYMRYNTEVVAVPTQSQDANFIFNELTSDFQEVILQGQVTFRITDPPKASAQFNFSISPSTYRPLSEDRNRIGRRIANLLQVATRAEVSRRTLDEVLKEASVLAGSVVARLKSGSSLTELGIEIQSADFLSIRPTPEIGKALEAELRESLLRKADEATYARRAAAVEAEHHIKEREMASDKSLEQQREGLIALRGANDLQESQNAAKSRAVSGQADADAARVLMEVYKNVSPPTLVAHALRELGARAGEVNNLTITTELLASLLKPQPAVSSENR
jgi:regulator of protease activity HflC (stomatin/prohibitin superfamily)